MKPLADNPLLNYFINNNQRAIHKWTHYFEIYHRCLAPYRHQENLKFLEIGIQNGGSAQMWNQYFTQGSFHYIGLDIDPRCKVLEKEGLEVWIGDQASRDFWAGFRQKHPQLDIVLDDGGHTMEQQITTFIELFPALSDGGLYICEDTHSSYLSKLGGGLKKPGTFHEFVKGMIDDMHGWYHQSDEAIAKNYLCNHLYSISVYDSVIVMEKRRKNPPMSLATGFEGPISNPVFMDAKFLKSKLG